MMNTPQNSIQTWRWATTWSIVILLLSCVPYLIATLTAPDGWHFAGILVNPLDGHSYLAKMRQGQGGNWLFHLTYTPEPHEGAFIFTFYLLLGHLAALTVLPPILIFHAARLAAGFFLLQTALRFIVKVAPHPAEQKLAFVLLLSASGLGWLGIIFGAFPIDLWVPEAFTPYSLYANPHFPLGMALMLIILQRVVWPPDRPGLSSAAISQIGWTGLIALILALILPFALLTVWAILALYLIWLYFIRRCLPWTQIWPTLSAGLFPAPVILYDYWVSSANPILAGWGVQNVTPAPSLLNLGLGYGLIGLLAIGGGWRIIRDETNWSETALKPGLWLVFMWAVVTILLIYAPFALQRRLITGLHVPVCILAAIGLRRGLAQYKFKPRRQRQLTTAVVTLSALGSIFVWSLPLLNLRQSPNDSPLTALFFMRQEEIVAFDWLRDHTAPDDVILASPRVGMFVPGQIGARAFYGHPFETVEAGVKQAVAEAFYRGEEVIPPTVDFIIYGPSERALANQAQSEGGLNPPIILENYPIVFSTEEVVVYKITD